MWAEVGQGHSGQQCRVQRPGGRADSEDLNEPSGEGQEAGEVARAGSEGPFRLQQEWGLLLRVLGSHGKGRSSKASHLLSLSKVPSLLPHREGVGGGDQEWKQEPSLCCQVGKWPVLPGMERGRSPSSLL